MKIAEEISKSIWKEVGEDAFKRAVTTLVGESVKAVIEVVKKRQLRLDQFQFQQWKKDVADEERAAEAEDSAETADVEQL